MSPEAGPETGLRAEPWAGLRAELRAGLDRVPPGLEAEPQRGEDKGKDWGRGGPPAPALRVEVGLSEHGEAVLRVRVELGLPPWVEVLY